MNNYIPSDRKLTKDESPVYQSPLVVPVALSALYQLYDLIDPAGPRILAGRGSSKLEKFMKKFIINYQIIGITEIEAIVKKTMRYPPKSFRTL
jgi:hypothetical protein